MTHKEFAGFQGNPVEKRKEIEFGLNQMIGNTNLDVRGLQEMIDLDDIEKLPLSPERRKKTEELLKDAIQLEKELRKYRQLQPISFNHLTPELYDKYQTLAKHILALRTGEEIGPLEHANKYAERNRQVDKDGKLFS